MRKNISDCDSFAPPRLALSHSFWALGGLPKPPHYYLTQLQEHGFESIEVGLTAANLELARSLHSEFGLKVIGHGWANSVEEAKPYVEETARFSGWALNLQLGHAYMSSGEAADLANRCRELSATAGLLLLVETHRGKMTQDLYRTADWIRLAPDVNINLDVSHYIVAGEGYGGSKELFFNHLEPIIERTSMIHARIGNGECVQSDIGVGGESPNVAIFFDIWVRAMRQWRTTARTGDVFVFEPELGPPPYAQIDLQGRQISDTWQQSLVMAKIGKRAWVASTIPPDTVAQD